MPLTKTETLSYSRVNLLNKKYISRVLLSRNWRNVLKPSISLIRADPLNVILYMDRRTDRQTDNIYSMTTFLKLNPFCVSQVRSTANDAMVHCLAQKDTDLAEERDPEQFGRRWREDLLFQDDLFSHCYNLKRMFVSLFLPVVEVSNKLNSAVFEMVLSLVRSKSRTTCVT